MTARRVDFPRSSSGHRLRLFGCRKRRRLPSVSKHSASPRHRDGFELAIVVFHVMRTAHDNRVTNDRHRVS